MSESGANGRSSLSARVAEFVKAQPATRRSARARAAVIAQREEIARAIADGWAVKTIWQTLKADGSVTVGYHAFLRQVAEVVMNTTETKSRTDVGARSCDAVPAKEPPHLAVPTSQSRFAHSPAPQKDEIY